MAKGMSDLRDLFVRELRDLLYAEKRLAKELPKMARAASDQDLKAALDEHAAQTREHVTRLEQVFQIVGAPARPERCHGMDGLLEEASHMQEQARGRAVRDAAMIAAAQRVEHYEIAAYGCARAYANHLRLDEAVGLLDQTLGEEGAADKALTDIAQRRVNPDASMPAPDDGEPERPVGTRRRRRRSPAKRTPGRGASRSGRS